MQISLCMHRSRKEGKGWMDNWMNGWREREWKDWNKGMISIPIG